MIIEFIINNLVEMTMTKEYTVNYHKMEIKVITLSTNDVDSTIAQRRYLAKER